MMTAGIPWPVAYGALCVGMACIGWITYLILKLLESRRSRHAAAQRPGL